jgi:hypothetical protein
MKGNTMTVKKHILSYLRLINECIGEPTFRTSDIQDLSYDWKEKYGSWLGSVSSYERAFRKLRTDNVISVKQIQRPPKQHQASWVLTNIT